MNKKRIVFEARKEEFLAKLTTAAYGVALRHGLRGSFLDAQMEIWFALREILQGEHFGQDSLLSDEPEIICEEGQQQRGHYRERLPCPA